MAQQTQTSINLSNRIWSVANDLWGDFKHTDFARIVLPLLLLRRLECVLEPTKKDVLAAYNAQKDSSIDPELYLPSIAKTRFFNTSEYELATLGATDTRANLEDYISHFSANVRLIFDEFGFANTIVELDKARLLHRIVMHFANMDLSKENVTDRDMSNAYEDIIRKFAASINEKAAEFFTPRDVVHLVTMLVLMPDEEVFSGAGVIRKIYDGACGVGGFLSDAIELIRDLSPNATVVPYGQELDPRTHAMALTSMLIQGFNEKNIKQGSTLSDDKLKGDKFHYSVQNPPFGIKWEKDRTAVVKENALGYAGRFGAGLPRVSDGSMLFVMNAVDKMEDPKNGGGRVGIVLSVSPLFTGDAGSGESEIRRWLLEQDLVEAIIALPTDMFFNTGIGTYVWILSNKKDAARKNKVQLVNLTNTWTQMRKSEGSKRRFISNEQIQDIVREYGSFTENKNIKIFDSTDFAYRKVHIKRPLRAHLVINEEKIESLGEIKAFEKLTDSYQNAWKSFFKASLGTHDYHWILNNLRKFNSDGGYGKVAKPLLAAFTNHFMERDESLEPILDTKGQVIVDTTLNDTESVPFKESVEEYFEREVKPHVHDAFIDYSIRDEKDGEVGIVGYEINFNRYFYEYKGHRPLAEIDAELKASEARIQALLQEVAE